MFKQVLYSFILIGFGVISCSGLRIAEEERARREGQTNQSFSNSLSLGASNPFDVGVPHVQSDLDDTGMADASISGSNMPMALPVFGGAGQGDSSADGGQGVNDSISGLNVPMTLPAFGGVGAASDTHSSSAATRTISRNSAASLPREGERNSKSDLTRIDSNSDAASQKSGEQESTGCCCACWVALMRRLKS